MPVTLEQAMERGVGYLTAITESDGSWADFDDLPVGAADQWVTGYLAFALVESGVAAGVAAAHRAALWLAAHRTYAEGWGYNATTRADADSTAYVVLALQACGLEIPHRALEWLRGRWQEHGGFATYPRADGWGLGHPCVTPTAYLALARAGQRDLTEAVVAHLERTRAADGTWPAYWWRGAAYSTYVTARLLAEEPAGAALRQDRGAWTSRQRDGCVESSFEVACWTAASVLSGASAETVQRSVARLLDEQRTDGSWPGSDNLRVTDPSCAAPWRDPRGQRYTDWRATITTASCVRALAYVRDHTRAEPRRAAIEPGAHPEHGHEDV